MRSRIAFLTEHEPDFVRHAGFCQAMARSKMGFVLLLVLCGPRCFVECAESDSTAVGVLLERYCHECHAARNAEADVNLELSGPGEPFAERFRTWEMAIIQLRQQTMPPAEAKQPSQTERQQLLRLVETGLELAAAEYDGDPGHVVIRRLTGAEYEHTIHDLTGLDLDLRDDVAGDAVGGAGFTNTGIVQFFQDSTLQLYLEAARRIASHAVIGAGPLTFFGDPGDTGFELSAIARIQQIYRWHGFRSAAGEGGEAFGEETYSKALFVAWLFAHRERLGLPDRAAIADAEGVDVRFADYIHRLVSRSDLLIPTSEIAELWRRLPPSSGDQPEVRDDIREECREIADVLRDWQLRFAANTDAKEEAPMLRADLFQVSDTQLFEMNVDWPPGTETAHLVLSVRSAIAKDRPDAVVYWREPMIQFRNENLRLPDPSPLREHLSQEVVARLQFGAHPHGGTVGENDFVTVGTKPVKIEVPIPTGARLAVLTVTGELDIEHGPDCIVRCTIEQLEETDQGKSVSGLLATNPDSDDFETWKAGVVQFARLMPQVSHQEPAPSDRDLIPPPFDTSYNNAERNEFHAKFKYHRDDRFLVDHILDDKTRTELDQAWTDLLGSFEFHDLWLRFIASKFAVDLDGRKMADLDGAWIDLLSERPRQYVEPLYEQYQATHKAFAAAESGHVGDVLAWAARAWRHPLSPADEVRLRTYYRTMRADRGLQHRAAIRALLTRVLVSPNFLYRAEHSEVVQGVTALNDWELAARLSYFLRSSVPDDELRRAAAAGELKAAANLTHQARRMLSDPGARRFAEEFFGQWLGVYRFDEHRGIDTQRFPEFTSDLRSAMHEEAVTFFDHVVRTGRPLDDLLFADYAFLNDQLAAHYGIRTATPLSTNFERVDHVLPHHRGGLLRLGAVLTVTSAPLRTSAVKRGDWILRRILGTPVPPPPADAGSIAGDDVLADGLTVRQRLEAHRQDVSCVNCHSRIDAFGFALEQYDPLGRWRNQYRDGQTIDASGELRDGTKISGPADLHKFLLTRRSLFYRTLSRKLLGYALGRREQVGDLPLLDEMVAHLVNAGDMAGLIERIVVSRQFRYHGTNDQADAQLSRRGVHSD